MLYVKEQYFITMLFLCSYNRAGEYQKDKLLHIKVLKFFWTENFQQKLLFFYFLK